jgi:hypothetical protein
MRIVNTIEKVQGRLDTRRKFDVVLNAKLSGSRMIDPADAVARRQAQREALVKPVLRRARDYWGDAT